jgi:hypothetical protein
VSAGCVSAGCVTLPGLADQITKMWRHIFLFLVGGAALAGGAIMGGEMLGVDVVHGITSSLSKSCVDWGICRSYKQQLIDIYMVSNEAPQARGSRVFLTPPPPPPEHLLTSFHTVMFSWFHLPAGYRLHHRFDPLTP